jgi:hypothetical protein
MPLKKVTDGPLFAAGPGTLSSLVNMELQPGGYAEARGGMEKLKPLGGTVTDAISVGGYSAAHQVTSSYGWVRTRTAAGAFSGNLQFSTAFYPFGAIPAVDNACYFGADLPFSRISVFVANTMAPADMTFVFEYWNGSTWGTLTTAETFSAFLGSDVQSASWTMKTDWVASSEGDVATGRILKYWMRIRVATVAVAASISWLWVQGSWVGMRELYAADQSPRTSAMFGNLRRYGQNGTAGEWYGVIGNTFAANASPTRLASYRGRIFMVNGKEAKRWDGVLSSNIGLPAFAATATVGAAGAGAGMGAGIWRYYVAWGYGPLEWQAALTVRDNIPSLYGPGEAVYAGVERTTTVGNEQVAITITGTIPTDASSCLIYRTNDLTNVPVGERGNHPAFLQGVLWRSKSGGNAATELINLGVFTDIYPTPIFPRAEAFNYSTRPKDRPKFIAVYQNRMFLGNDDYWYWSDPFKPDIFLTSTNYIALARAQGGRHMGGVEFADQVVLYTEDQTWGLTNVDLDAPQLLPIHPGIGCIAPDSIATGDGLLVWCARDGVYAWDGSPNAPIKVSGDFEQTFGRMSYETHGGSKATIHARRYDVTLSSPDYGTILGTFRLNFETMKWSTLTLAGFSSTLFPLATIHAPLGNNDAGGLHPLWGKVDYGIGAGDYSLYLGELTTQDSGTNYTCSATMHFPLPPNSTLTPSKLAVYYQAVDGWGTPTLANAVANPIGSTPGTLTADNPNTGTDYSLLMGTYSGVGATSDIQATFSVSSAAGGTVSRQRLFGAVLKGKAGPMRRQFV